MEKIKALKEKHKLLNANKLKELIRTGFPCMQVNLKYQRQHLLELNMKLRELRSEASRSEEFLIAKEHILRVKLEEYTMATKNLKELEVDRNKLLLEVHQLESHRNCLKNKKPSRNDKKIIEHGKKKLDHYKQLTGIRWDFGTPKGIIKGYVTNGKDLVRTFTYRNKEQDSLNLENELWKEVARETKRL